MPTPAEIKVLAPDPEFIIVPVLLTEVPDKVILLGVALLFCKIKFPIPVPVTPPVTVRAPPVVLIKVVPPDATVSAAVVIFNGDVPF